MLRAGHSNGSVGNGRLPPQHHLLLQQQQVQHHGLPLGQSQSTVVSPSGAYPPMQLVASPSQLQQAYPYPISPFYMQQANGAQPMYAHPAASAEYAQSQSTPIQRYPYPPPMPAYAFSPVAPQHLQQNGSNLAAIPVDQLYAYASSQQPLPSPFQQHQQTSPPNSSGSVLGVAPTHSSYTEHWANQLPYWGNQSTATNGDVMSEVSQSVVQRMVPIPQRTAVVNPMMATQQVGSLDSSGRLTSPTRPLDMSLGELHKENGHNLTLESSSSVGGISARRRTINGPPDDELEERHAKMLEAQQAYDSQVAEKRRIERIEAERERREIAEKERERLRIEMTLAQEADEEHNRWKQRNENEKRTQALLDSLEKARKEAELTRKARLLNHALDAYDPSIAGDKQRALIGDENLGDFEKAREFVHAVDRQKKLDHERIYGVYGSNGGGNQPTTPKDFDGSSTSRSKSLPPVGPKLPPRVPPLTYDDRPIRPAAQTYSFDGEASAPSSTTPLTRRVPSRSSMRPPRRSSAVANQRMTRRADSLERLGKEQADEEQKKNTSETVNGGSPVFPTPPPKQQQKGTTKPATNDSKATTEEEEAPKLLNRRQSIDSRTLPATTQQKPPPVPNQAGQPQQKAEKDKENPWGDSLGGLNPLFQPLITRPRRARPAPSTDTPPLGGENGSIAGDGGGSSHSTGSAASAVSDTSSVDERPPPPPYTPIRSVFPVRKARPIAPASMLHPVENGENKTKQEKIAASLAPAKAENGTSITPPADQSIRSPSIDAFNHKSSQYRSFNVKRPGTGDRQQKILEQLSALRAQLKNKQKAVEDAFKPAPPIVPARRKLHPNISSLVALDGDAVHI
uniref:CCDC66 domain-containing protein n=1 Tax=Plectus sambesii TaxID=2011161 RepID=A0A914W726_9BILA